MALEISVPLQAHPPLESERLRKRGLEDFEEFDPTAEVETPRSLAACMSEGIRPKDLIYVPREAFDLPDVSAQLADMRYQYFEALRQDLLTLARAAHSSIIAGEPPVSSFGKGVGLEYKFCHEYFRQQLQAVDLKAIPAVPDWTTAPRSEEFKPMDMFAGARANGPKRASPSSAFLQSSDSKDLSHVSHGSFETTGKPWYEVSSADWRSTTDKEALLEMLHKSKTAPGSDWREVESARRVEDTFGVLRELKLKARDERHGAENRQIETNRQGLESSFEKLHFEQSRLERMREIREHMMPPADPKYTEVKERAKNNRIQVMQQAEDFRKEYFVKHASKKQAIEKRIEEERTMNAMKYAQLNVEDRVRWKHNYQAVVGTRANERQGVLDNFVRRQAQLDAGVKAAADAGFIKQELGKLRHAHRQLFDHRSERKAEYDKKVRSQQIRDGADKRIEASRKFGAKRGLPDKTSQPASPASPGLPASPASPASAGSPASPTSAPPVGLVPTDEDPREQFSPAEIRWMRRALRGDGRGRGVMGLTPSASAPAIQVGR